LQTTVSVVVYDAKDVADFVEAASGAYDRTLKVAADMSPGAVERCDCADDSTVALPAMSKGLTVLYRAPNFGRMRHKQAHSGWECWRVVEQGPRLE
jgi:hypothetical protein